MGNFYLLRGKGMKNKEHCKDGGFDVLSGVFRGSTDLAKSEKGVG